MSLNGDQNLECPLCMEPFEMDDFSFFPCTCGYQICRFCWHRIRTDENELCPACRKKYPEDPADFKPMSAEELQKIKTLKRQKDQQKKQKMSECRKHLSNVRVVQKNLVFVVGLPTRLADSEVLKKNGYFGKFGKIHKVVVNQSTSYAGSQGPSASAYVTYCRPEDALRAIKSVNNIQVDGRTLKASLGTTKYCSHFLKNLPCVKTDCMYLHELGDEAASFTKEDMQQGKHQEYEKKLQDQILGCNNNNNRKQSTSPTPQENIMISVKDAWPCTVQNTKESRTNRTKESTQTQRTENKNSRSKSKHSTEGQKSKKTKVKTTDSGQHNSTNKTSSNDENSAQRKNHKTKQSKESSTQGPSPPTIQRLEDIPPTQINGLSSNLTEITEMNLKNAQTTFVHIAEQATIKPVSASIQIARCESPVLPPSPISSSSSSLFTPFGSLSSNFMSSSSPSPPPSNSNPHSFGNVVNSFSTQESGSPVDSFAAPSMMEHHNKCQSPNHLFNMENNDSLFSHMNYPISSDCGSYNNLPGEEQSPVDNSDWNSDFSYADSQSQPPEDDLDFDPWNESSKGLADLMAKEANHNSTYSEMHSPPGFFQPIKTPVPNQQRIGVPPPGFCTQQFNNSNSLGPFHGMYGPNNSDYLSNKLPPYRENRPSLNNGPLYYQDAPHNSFPTLNHYKQQLHPQQQQQQQQQQFPHPNSQQNIIENLRQKKNWEERFRTLFPDVLYCLNNRGMPPKSQNQNGSTWNNQSRDLGWQSNESPMFNSGNITDGQRNSPQFWMKALQQLTIEENSTQFNGHSPYATPFALRGQWPAAQCPPPGFVAPTRSSANTPFQHIQVNQKI